MIQKKPTLREVSFISISVGFLCFLYFYFSGLQAELITRPIKACLFTAIILIGVRYQIAENTQRWKRLRYMGKVRFFLSSYIFSLQRPIPLIGFFAIFYLAASEGEGMIALKALALGLLLLALCWELSKAEYEAHEQEYQRKRNRS